MSINGHPNAPRTHAKKLILDWMRSEEGPRFRWRRGSKAYSERDEAEYNVREWREKYDEEIFGILISRAKQTESKAGSPDVQVREDAAWKAYKMWAGPAFMVIFKELPQRGHGEVTASEEAEVVAAVVASLSKTLKIYDGMAEMYIARSVLRLAIERGEVRWRQVPNQGAWIKAGPRIAISYDFLMDHGDKALKRFGRKALACALRKFGIAESDNFTSGQRGYVVYDKWLSETFEFKLVDAPEQPEFAMTDVKKAAAGDKDKDDEPIPF